MAKAVQMNPKKKNEEKEELENIQVTWVIIQVEKKQMCVTHCSGKVEKWKFAYLHGFPNVK